MRSKPPYFNRVFLDTIRQWDTLKNDPVLAAPWHQLFRQVQSPRHVLSELLQNADDAGATTAEVRIEEGVFFFSHNGRDFDADQFTSLCRFGSSSKHTLHTIGFRGIGFKTVFSLGSPVYLATPSLGVRFERSRFTLPLWESSFPLPCSPATTTIQVRVEDENRLREIESNVAQWKDTPFSLLFFRNLRRLRFADGEVAWVDKGAGPSPGSRWFQIESEPWRRFLVSKSSEEPFPGDAIAEISQERAITDEKFPPCTVELVIEVEPHQAPGTAAADRKLIRPESRLFVVLPTEVRPNLPFLCNAPFIQDPARDRVKDPSISPTNRWLLDRIGRHAAETMLAWLSASAENVDERARAYGLFLDPAPNGDSIDTACSTIVRRAFEMSLAGRPLLLTDAGSLVPAKSCVALPEEVFEVWPTSEMSIGLPGEQDSLPAFRRHVAARHRGNLKTANLLDVVSKEQFFLSLATTAYRKPPSWECLLLLWRYIASNITDWRRKVAPEEVRIVPAEGENLLRAASQVVRVPNDWRSQADDDVTFLASHVSILDPEWNKFLAQRPTTDRDAAHAIFKVIGLDSASTKNRIIEIAASNLSRDGSSKDWIRLGQIAARLDVAVSESFLFVTADGIPKSLSSVLMFDEDGGLAAFLPPRWAPAHLLHEDYAAGGSCTPVEWREWVYSGHSGIPEIPPILGRTRSFGWNGPLEKALKELGCRVPPAYPSTPRNRHSFLLQDFDFPPEVASSWGTGEAPPPLEAARAICERLLRSRATSVWDGKLCISAFQLMSQGSSAKPVPIPIEEVAATWLRRLKSIECLPDTKGTFHRPEALHRRTDATLPLEGVEPFIAKRLDTDYASDLLDALGVRSRPAGPERLLDRLEALSRAEVPPHAIVDDIYQRLDAILASFPPEAIDSVAARFEERRLVLSEQAVWEGPSSVFLRSSEEEAPGALTIRETVRDLQLWQKIGVAERQTGEMAISWLRSLPISSRLESDVLRRVRALQGKWGPRVWSECCAWLNLLSEWTPSDRLEFSLSPTSDAPWKELFDDIKLRTADLRCLTPREAASPPFDSLDRLESVLEFRLESSRAAAIPKPLPAWIAAMCDELQWFIEEGEPECERVRMLARTLLATQFFETSRLELRPYVKGIGAGAIVLTKAMWDGTELYYERTTKHRLAKALAETLSRRFHRPDIALAFSYCFDRDIDDVTDYIRENFKVTPVAERVLVTSPSRDSDTVEAPPAEGTSLHPPPSGQAASPEPPPDAGRLGNPIPIALSDDAPALAADGQAVEASVLSSEDATAPQEIPLEDPAPVESRRKAPDPNIVERFLLKEGFVRIGANGVFVRPTDGWRANQVHGSPFPWELLGPDGLIQMRYWGRDHCLEREPLEVRADLWDLLELHPNKCSMVLADPEGNPISVLGVRLKELKDAGRLRLFPASLRIVKCG